MRSALIDVGRSEREKGKVNILGADGIVALTSVYGDKRAVPKVGT